MSDQNFGRGLSPKLQEFALKHRPPSSELNFEQIKTLAIACGYRVRGEDLSHFVLYSINGGDEDIGEGVGIQTGLRLNWKISISSSGLSFTPSLQTLMPGQELKPSPAMIKNLERHLSKVGIKPTDEVPWPKGDHPVLVPVDLYNPKDENSVRFYFKSEFMPKYHHLYRTLKHWYENE